jgi:hypothetical protein
MVLVIVKSTPIAMRIKITNTIKRRLKRRLPIESGK